MAKKKQADDRIKEVPIKQITMDKALQPRTALTAEAVKEYAEAMQDGAVMPPCQVVFDATCPSGQTYWLCDGFHRVTAAMELKFKSIACEVIEGTRDDAMWLAAAANLKHGVRRTNFDKRRAVQMALMCKPDSSLREVAEHCAVTHEFVRSVKSQAEAVNELNAEAQEAVADAIEDGVIDGEDDSVSARMVAAEAAVKSTMKAVDEATAAVNALMLTEHAAFVSQQRVLTDLKNAKTALRQSLPHEVCPLCGGEGCETCRMTGWVTKQQWDLIPADQKG
jgi:hypothetical protein